MPGCRTTSQRNPSKPSDITTCRQNCRVSTSTPEKAPTSTPSAVSRLSGSFASSRSQIALISRASDISCIASPPGSKHWQTLGREHASMPLPQVIELDRATHGGQDEGCEGSPAGTTESGHSATKGPRPTETTGTRSWPSWRRRQTPVAAALRSADAFTPRNQSRLRRMVGDLGAPTGGPGARPLAVAARKLAYGRACSTCCPCPRDPPAHPEPAP